MSTSATTKEASKKLGIPCEAFRRMRRKFRNPPQNSEGIDFVALYRARPPIPRVIIRTKDGRRYVGTLVGTEGCVTCAYAKPADTTELVIVVEMTDRDWIVKFSEEVGLTPPPEMGRDVSPKRKAKFRRAPSGLRALRILKEILPYLYGQRLREAQRAIEYFSPSGHVKGMVRAAEIWGDLRL